MTKKVYCVLSFKASLLLLVSKPLKHTLKDFYCLPTGMTTEVYPIRQPLASLGKLASKPLKTHSKRLIYFAKVRFCFKV